MYLLAMMQEQKGTSFLNPINGKIAISRDVVFDEASSWDWGNPHESYN